MRIEKYDARYWAVYDDTNKLVCVTVYKKGSNEVVLRLQSNDAAVIENLKQKYKDISNLKKENTLSESNNGASIYKYQRK
ncbi:hypothetical protein [Petroclostridium sp. X23]|uniref:hypothetical protein n=1 Tax=Petroclostridium sp. X23 TaxID=3045146 RepID=UPI0024AD4B73|nr:hypothetical protein [Petroclostridium sp. X23]WHH57191.1 hypothetical protein QKW49_15240 [Petroclostridium sp. X23]